MNIWYPSRLYQIHFLWHIFWIYTYNRRNRIKTFSQYSPNMHASRQLSIKRVWSFYRAWENNEQLCKKIRFLAFNQFCMAAAGSNEPYTFFIWWDHITIETHWEWISLYKQDYCLNIQCRILKYHLISCFQIYRNVTSRTKDQLSFDPSIILSSNKTWTKSAVCILKLNFVSHHFWIPSQISCVKLHCQKRWEEVSSALLHKGQLLFIPRNRLLIKNLTGRIWLTNF